MGNGFWLLAFKGKRDLGILANRGLFQLLFLIFMPAYRNKDGLASNLRRLSYASRKAITSAEALSYFVECRVIQLICTRFKNNTI